MSHAIDAGPPKSVSHAMRQLVDQEHHVLTGNWIKTKGQDPSHRGCDGIFAKKHPIKFTQARVVQDMPTW